MQEVICKSAEIIEGISRDDFHKKFIRGICQSREFGYLETFLAEHTPEDYKIKVRKDLEKLGVPLELTESDYDLNNTITAITSRAVELR